MLGLLLTIILAGLIAGLMWVQNYGQSRPAAGELTLEALIPLVSLLAIVAAVIAALTWLTNGLKVACPKCGHEAGPHDHARWLTVGRCTRCEEALWPTEESVGLSRDSEVSAQLLSRDAFTAWNRTVRLRPTIIVPYLAAAAAVGGMMWSMRPLFVSIWVEHWGSITLPLLDVFLAAPSVVIAPCGLMAALRDVSRQLKEHACPHCRSPLGDAFLVRTTGRCVECGTRVLADPLPPLLSLTAKATRPLSDFVTDRRNFRRVAWLQCLIGGLAAGLWMALIWKWLPVTSQASATPWQIVLMCQSIVIQMGATVLSGRWFARRLKCPACRGSIESLTRLVIASGNCPHCTRRIVARGE